MRRSRLGFILALLAVALLCGVLSYRPLARRALTSKSLSQLLDRQPDRFRIRWREASSPFPGEVRLVGLEISGRTPSVRWRITADRARGVLHAWAFVRRTIRFEQVRAEGVEVEIEHLVAGQGSASGALRPAKARPWAVELRDLRIDQGRGVDFNRVRVRGPFIATGGFRLVFGRTFELFPSRVSWRRGDVAVAGVPALANLDASLEATIEPLAPRQDKGWRSFPFVSGKARLSGDLASIAFLEAFLPSLPWMDLESGGGPLRAAVEIDHGRWVQGSFVEVPAQRAVIDVLQYQVGGACRLGWHVEADRAVARADISRAEVGYREATKPHLVVPEMQLVLTTRDLDLNGELTEFSAEAVLPEAQAPALSRYNELLPRASGVAIEEGSGRFSTRLTIDSAGRARGTMSLGTSGLRARLSDLDFRGDCRLDLALASADVRALRFDLDGSRGRCEGVQVGQSRGDRGGDWWLEGTLGDSFAEPRGAERLHLSATLRARDAEPFLALFGGARGAKIAARILRAKPFGAEGQLSLGRSAWRLEGDGTAGPKLGLEARLEGRESSLAGDLLLHWGQRALGIELGPQGRDFHFRGAREWFAANERRP